MASIKRCCVPNCDVTVNDNVPMHCFPHPEKDPERFQSWLRAVGGNLWVLDFEQIYKTGKVCHKHFEDKYRTWTRTLSKNAVPTLHLRGSKKPLSDVSGKIINQNTIDPEKKQPSSSTYLSALDKMTSNELSKTLLSAEPIPGPLFPSKTYPPKTSKGTMERNVSIKSVSLATSSSSKTLALAEPVPGPSFENIKTYAPKAKEVATANETVVPMEPVTQARDRPMKRPAPAEPVPSHKSPSKKMNKVPKPTANVTYLQKLVKKLQKKKETYAQRLKRASKLSENTTFQKYIGKFTTLAALFTLMQFREISKPKMGRRFTLQEKLMALSLYKQGPRAYRWLSKVFVLPSPITLNRLISKAGIKPGINEKIFNQLKERVQSMSDDEKLCVVMFDEMSISPNFEYNRKKDLINGFTNNGTNRRNKIADHALVFMIRGVIKNYKQPISYTFCNGTTPADELKVLIKNIITKLQDSGLHVLATICDQGSTNVSAINKLIEETRQNHIKKNKNYNREFFEINHKEIVPLFDVPHLLKGIRNNLITKNLKCVLESKTKIAKWEHILNLYNENPGYKGIKLIKNLSEAHVIPQKISKMKVKYASQLFSKTVATNMGYLADKKIIPEECKETADILLFFDELFDSMNGSYNSSRKKSGKSLLGPVTPNSEHFKTWETAKKVLSTMKFVTKNGKAGTVPSISNWLRTINNIEYLTKKIFSEYSFKSLWMRHLNQDPLENFFGSIRSHGCRNISPTPSGFETAFLLLLVSNVTKHHSKGANCEEDFCKSFDSMVTLFTNEDESALKDPIITEVDYEDIFYELTSFEQKKRDPRVYAQLCYVTGYIVRQARKKIFKNCKNCKDCFYSTGTNEYITRREHVTAKRCLTYPSENIVIFFSQMQDIINYILEKKSIKFFIKNYCKTLIYSISNCNFVMCEDHKDKVTDFIVDLACRFFINSWCRDINRLLNGTNNYVSDSDGMKKSAALYHKKHAKSKK